MVKEERVKSYQLLMGTKPECYLDNSTPLALQILQLLKVV